MDTIIKPTKTIHYTKFRREPNHVLHGGGQPVPRNACIETDTLTLTPVSLIKRIIIKNGCKLQAASCKLQVFISLSIPAGGVGTSSANELLH